LDLGRRRLLRGREVGLVRFRIHTNNLVSGLMFVALGVVFIAYEGTSVLSGFYESRGATDAVFAAEQWATGLAGSFPVGAVLVAIGAVLASVLTYRTLSRRSTATAESRRREERVRPE
jgi:membrane protein implicated in regulation of membrane protease activity